jgi:hypothetical protein
MKTAEKGFRNNFRKFRASTKKVPCDTKLPLYWQLIEDCMEKNSENVEFVRERWNGYTMTRIMRLEKKMSL